MSKTSPLINIFSADPKASVVPIRIEGLSLPKVESAGLLVAPDYSKVEGRGTYEELGDGLGRYRYVKGSGNLESLRSHGENDPRVFPQFGHISSRKYLFGDGASVIALGQTAPRVKGALALPYAVGEVINAAVFLDLLMRKEGISTVRSAEEKGLTIPEGAIYSPAISTDICDGLARARRECGMSDTGQPLPHKYGLASLRVPACARLRTRDDVTATKGEFWTRVLRSPEKMEMVGRVLRHQFQCGFVSLSTHLQNIYDAPNSLCPHADSSDLVPISEVMDAGARADIDAKDLLQAIVMRQLQYIPFNLMRYAEAPTLQNDAKGAIHTILSTIAPGEWSRSDRERFAMTFQQKPYTVFATIAERLIDMKLVEVSPQADWGTIHRRHARFGYDFVAEHMTRIALANACSLYTAVAQAEGRGGLSDLC